MSAPFEPQDLERELEYAYSRSSGPGGQNVNKVETRVTLQFDVERSAVLSDLQKYRVSSKLATRINKEGILQVSSQRHRTREANRAAALERFFELIAEALSRPKARRKTRVSRAAKKRRLESKRQRGEIKKRRTGRDWD